MERVYENIKTLRTLHRHTQKYVADELDITQSYYSRLERGLVDIPLSQLIKIASFYRLDQKVLVNDDLTDYSIEMLHKK